jgi:transcriptional regulator with XRE-family HTH domain
MSQPLAQIIATEIRAEMGRQNLSGRQLAEAVGLSQTMASRRLRGLIEFRPSELDKIADLLGVPVTQFMRQPATSAA